IEWLDWYRNGSGQALRKAADTIIDLEGTAFDVPYVQDAPPVDPAGGADDPAVPDAGAAAETPACADPPLGQGEARPSSRRARPAGPGARPPGGAGRGGAATRSATDCRP